MAAIIRYLKSNLAPNQDFESIIVQSSSWHELTILFFANSFELISKKLLSIRNADLSDLETFSDDGLNNIIDASLLSKHLTELGEDNLTKGINNIKKSHLFVHSHTILGFDLEILNNPQKYQNLPIESNISFSARWFLKPGHLNEFVSGFRSLIKKKKGAKEELIIGKGDISYTFEDGSLSNYLAIIKLIEEKGLKKHVRKVYTVPKFPFAIFEEDYKDYEEHYPFHSQLLKKYGFSVENIHNLQADLSKLRVSKITREKVVNLYVNFNDGINDPILYGYFIEMRPFLKKLRQIIVGFLENPELETVEEAERLIDKIVDRVDRAFKNRFGQSYLMNEITDYNIEFNGGIQQILSTYDAIYKEFHNLLNHNDDNNVFAFVTNNSGIGSDKISTRINYFQLFQPEIFLTVIMNEVARVQDSQNLVNNYDQFIKKLDHPTLAIAFEYFYADLVNYRFVFNNKFEVYYIWQNIVFLQNASMYKSGSGEIIERQFRNLLVRLKLIAVEFDRLDDIFKGKVIAPSINLQSVWDKNFKKIAQLISKNYAQANEDNGNGDKEESKNYPSLIYPIEIRLKLFENLEHVGKLNLV